MLDGQITEELHPVGSLGQLSAFCCELLEFDGSHLGAVLLALALTLCLCVVELVFDKGRCSPIFSRGRATQEQVSASRHVPHSSWSWQPSQSKDPDDQQRQPPPSITISRCNYRNMHAGMSSSMLPIPMQLPIAIALRPQRAAAGRVQQRHGNNIRACVHRVRSFLANLSGK
jgi:hypothetical protein